MIAQTSLLAYADIRGDLTKREREVLKVIEEHQPIDNYGIAELMGVPVHFITGRTNALSNPKIKFSEEVRPSVIRVAHIKDNQYGNKSKFWEVING